MQTIDADLAEFQAFLIPDETASSLLARTFVEPQPLGISFVDRVLSFRPGNVLEIVGPAGTAKSELLVQVYLAFGINRSQWLVQPPA